MLWEGFWVFLGARQSDGRLNQGLWQSVPESYEKARVFYPYIGKTAEPLPLILLFFARFLLAFDWLPDRSVLSLNTDATHPPIFVVRAKYVPHLREFAR